MKSWFFPDYYLREIEELITAIAETKGEKPNLALANVLIHAQAVGVYLGKQVERAGGRGPFLKGRRTKGGREVGRRETPNKAFFWALRDIAEAVADGVLDPASGEVEQPAQPEPEAQEDTTKTELAETWELLIDAYQEHAPAAWPQMSRRPKLAKMGSRVQEGISYAGGRDEFVALFASALSKVPQFYLETYVRKGGKLRPAIDCALCLLSADRNHKELGVAGWRMFEWAELIDAGEKPKAVCAHPSEEFVAWTGTRWTYRRPMESDEILNHHRQVLVSAGLAPPDAMSQS